ncbi:ABC transporter substrate-binding protein [Paenibacillus sp. N3.4]|uniref:ABC transporter substrate-binding protein n=1 Tax=Paenibacillus sp. N3.4 TaxID=2603222 RepID=UPI0011C94C6F|nr:ABC transporter substrate-binding protein [Paenibacillus sp. N3.4]TXK77415.1 ABC transporter substrate-binding protein [Paenibacillus sp. N3.4]
MKVVKKSVLTLSILLLSISFVLVGCSEGNSKDSVLGGDKQPTATNNSGNESIPATQLKPYKLKLVYPGSIQPDQVKVQEAMNKILQPKINATIELMPIDWGQWDNKANLMIASREKFDIMFTAQWNGHAVNVSKGAFLPMNDDSLDKYGNLLKKHGQGIIDSLNPIFLEGAKINGKNYAVPTNKELAAQGGVIYRSDIAKELNLDMTKVKTIKDLEPILTSVKEKRPDMTPLFLRNGDNFNAHYIVQTDALGDASIPGVILKDQDKTKVVLTSDLDRYNETLKITRDFMKKGYINKDAATTSLGTGEALKSGNVFMVVVPLKPGKDAEMANGISLQGKLKQIEMTPKIVSTGETSGSMLGISTTSEDPERAMILINLLHTDKVLNNLLNFGIEGVHYEKVSDNIIKATDATKNYNPGASWMFGNQFLNYIWETEDPQKWDKFKEFNKDAKKSPGLGFTFNAEPVKTEVAALVNVGKEYDPPLDTGSVDSEKILPKYREKLKAAGLDKILAEKQKQLDAFLASKK